MGGGATPGSHGRARLGYNLGRVDPVAHLPLPAAELPEALRRFGDPAAPERARAAAARGIVPVKGADLVALLLQLAADPAEPISSAAKATLDGLPPAVVEAACEAPLHAAFLDKLADRIESKADLLERLVANAATASATVARVARHAPDRVCERIALNEERVLTAPEIVEALYKNKHARASTIDRLIDLCVRNGVRVEGIPTFDQHAEALQGQLIPEPDPDELLPSDAAFVAALEADAEEDAIDRDAVEGGEEVKDKFKPLSMRIAGMPLQEKLRLTLVGNSAARAILVRDSNRMVALATVQSPTMTEAEAASIAHSRQIAEEVLRFIGNKRDWLSNYEVKKALVFNPKTPVGVSMRFLSHLHTSDLRGVSKSRGIPAALKQAAVARLSKKGG